jgi:cysteine desulfurase family protein (TIGR01976 family)
MLDLDLVRASFPALASGYVYLDNAGGSQTLRGVADRARDYLLASNVQLGASYSISQRASARVAEAVAATAEYIGADGPEEIVIGPSTTQLLHNLVAAMAGQFTAGDEVVISEADHEANLGPWKRLAARGVVLRTWKLDRKTWKLEASGLTPLLGKRTKLVAFTHVSNLLGSIHDVAGLTRLIHAHGAKVCVDGVAYAPHRAVEVAAWDVDYYVFSFYKVFGPHVAVLYGKRALLDELAGINHEFITSGAYKLQPGNLNFELTYSLLGLYEYIAALGGRERAFADIAAHEERLAARLLDRFATLAAVTVHGEPSAYHQCRVPTISFSVAGKSPEAIVRAVDPHDIGIRHGDFYARSLARALVDSLPAADRSVAPAGVIRLSAAHYNTVEEIDRAAEVITAAVHGK